MQSRELWIETKDNSWDFIYDDNFYEGKLYKRYVNKIDNELKEYVDRIFGPQNGELVDSIIGFILNTIRNSDYNEKQTFPFKRIFLECNHKKICLFLTKFYTESDKKVDIYEHDDLFSLIALLEGKIDKLYRRHLERCLWDREIDLTKESMIWQTKFKNDYEKLSIIEELVETALSFIETYDMKTDTNVHILEEKVEKMYKDRINEMIEDHNSLVKDYNNLIADYNQLLDDFDLLRKTSIKELASAVSVNYDVKLIEDENNKKIREENKKLKLEMSSLEKENRNIKDETEDLRNILKLYDEIHRKNTDKTEEIDTFDYNKKILFVGGIPPILSKLSIIFPNMQYVMNNTERLNKEYINGFDAIVYITKFMSHSIGIKVKNLKSCNVRQIHTNKTNTIEIINMIKSQYGRC